MSDENDTIEAGAAATSGERVPTPPRGATRRLGGVTAGMAVGTTLSRLTGVGRVIALTAAVSGGGFADAYNLANTTPNIITDIVIGGVLAATFVPVFVSELTTREAKEAWEAISSVVTVTVVLVVVATIAFFVLTPSIIDLYTVTNHHADVHQQQVVATYLLRWFVPQFACYGLIALATALLNTQGRFVGPMFMPIANNLVVIGILVWFHILVPNPELATVGSHHSALVLLGIGTTLGVVVQAVLLVPSLLRSDLKVRFRWQPGHEAMRRIGRLAGWTFGIVLSNQVALVVVVALADGASVPGGVSAWTYAYTFFQLPYGVIAVSIMSAVTPSLSARWAEGNLVAFRHRMAFGLRSMLAPIIPSAVGMVILAHPLIDLVLAHGAETQSQASVTAATLAMFALGLPGFCTFLYLVRVLQAMQDTRTAFRIYLVENAINIALAITLVGPLGVRGLALAMSVAYSVAALIGLRVVAAKEGGIAGDDLRTPLTRVLVSTAAMAVATVLAVSVSGATSGLALLGRLAFAVLSGLIAFVGTTMVLGAREDRRTLDARAGRADRRSTDAASVIQRDVPHEPVVDGPRERAAFSSIRIVRPDPDADDASPAMPGEGGVAPGDDADDADGRRSPIPFRGRIAPDADTAPVRHLRPVPGGRGAGPPGPPGDGHSVGIPVDDQGAGGPPQDEE